MRCVLYFILALFGWLAALAEAAPRVIKSLAAQQPPVARVGADYVFTILPDTFAAGNGINYTASGLPDWLKFAPNNPTFYGVPTKNDVGESEVVLTATDATGATRNAFTLIVTEFAAPVVKMGISAQLKDPKSRDISSATVMPGNNGVSVPPFWSFSLGWSGETFARASRNNNGKLYYSAYVRGQTGLPDWIDFSNTTYTFNGVSPASGTYEIVLVGTDFWNHTAATTSFIFSVGDGSVVENSKPFEPIRTVSRNQVSYPLDLSGLLVNGQKADASQVSVSPNLTQVPWLSFDKASNTLSGTAPDNLVNGTAAPFSVPVTLSSSSSNASNTLSYVSYLNVSVLPYAFKTFQLPNTTLHAGEQFSFDLSQFLVNSTADKSAINATVVPGGAAEWLLYYPDNYTLTGNPSPNITYSAINVMFMSTTDGVASVTNITMPIEGVTGPHGDGDAAPVPIAPHSDGGLSKKNKIITGCVVGLGVPLLILLALLLFCCLRRRRRTERKTVAGDAEKEGTPDTLTNTPGGKSVATDGDATVVGGSPVKKSGPRRFNGIKGLFGTTAAEEPRLPSLDSKESALQPSDHGSFTGQGDILAVGGNRNVGTSGHRHPAGVTRSAVSFDSMDSFATGPSMHWSGESDYLEPLYERDDFNAMTPTSAGTGAVSSPTTQASTLATPTLAAAPLAAVTPGSLADSQRPRTASTGRDVADAAGDVPRPLPGFYPKFPRNIRPGDPAPFLSTDEVSMHFSEFDRDGSSNDLGHHSRSLVTSRSLDSFADQGSQIGGGSSGSRFGSSKHSRSASSGAWWGNSGLPADSSGTGMSGSGSSAEQAIVATAHRQSLDTQRSSAVNDVIDFSNADYSHADFAQGDYSAVTPPNMTPSTPTRPVSYLVVPAHVQQSYTPKTAPTTRRHSSSRRHQTARVQTREQIMGGSAMSHADGQPIVFSQPIPRAEQHNRHHT